MASHDAGKVYDADHDQRVRDAMRFIKDRRLEALALIALWANQLREARSEIQHGSSALDVTAHICGLVSNSWHAVKGLIL
ncbi:hypothetical protein BH23CHL5_BH23CHL5_17810 [soil metagenome]